jgi:hypothetical protein
VVVVVIVAVTHVPRLLMIDKDDLANLVAAPQRQMSGGWPGDKQARFSCASVHQKAHAGRTPRVIS